MATQTPVFLQERPVQGPPVHLLESTLTCWLHSSAAEALGPWVGAESS